MSLVKPIQKKLDVGMNKLEASYAAHLALRKNAGEIVDYRFEAVKLKLADKTTYTPDFVVVLDTHLEMHETKGFWRDDARVKIKVAAAMFPWFRFVAVEKKRGEWVFEVFGQ